MAEHKIIITIDEQGKITASTDGIKGEACMEELELLLGEQESIGQVKKTDEYDQKVGKSNHQSTKIKKK